MKQCVKLVISKNSTQTNFTEHCSAENSSGSGGPEILLLLRNPTEPVEAILQLHRIWDIWSFRRKEAEEFVLLRRYAG